jgi:hypothetical protein
LALRGVRNEHRDAECASLGQVAVIGVAFYDYDALTLINESAHDRNPHRAESDNDDVINHAWHFEATQ